MSPNNSALDEFASRIGATLGFPYIRDPDPGVPVSGVGQGLIDIATQAAVPDGATLVAWLSLMQAAEDPGDINVFTYSGGAQAFNSALAYLPEDVRSRIHNVTYIAPGSSGRLLATGNGITNVVTGNLDIVHLSSRIPSSASVTTTACGHNIACLLREASATLATASGDACANSAVISRVASPNVALEFSSKWLNRSGYGLLSDAFRMLQWTMGGSQIEIVSSVITW